MLASSLNSEKYTREDAKDSARIVSDPSNASVWYWAPILPVHFGALGRRLPRKSRVCEPVMPGLRELYDEKRARLFAINPSRLKCPSIARRHSSSTPSTYARAAFVTTVAVVST